MKNKKIKEEKKRGRPRKTKRLEDDGDSDRNKDFATAYNSNCNASSSPPGYESASLDEPMASKPQTRYSLSRGNKKAALSPQPRIPAPYIDGNSSEASTLMLVKQILFESNHVRVEAKDTHSELEGISPDQKIVEDQNGMTCSSQIKNHSPPGNNELDLKKFTLDLLAQTPQPDFPLQVASPSSNEIMVINNLPERDANVVFNISPNLTASTCENPTSSLTIFSVDNKSPQSHDVLSEGGDPLIDVEGYKVKKEIGPLLKAIFKRYGDIARESSFSMKSRSCLLDMVCRIYQRLDTSKLLELTPLELESMQGQIGDLQLVNVNIGWLHTRLNQITKARQIYDGVSTFEDFKARSVVVINEKQKAVQICEEELQACMAAAMKLQERLQQEKDELAAAQIDINIIDGSLVHDLV